MRTLRTRSTLTAALAACILATGAAGHAQNPGSAAAPQPGAAADSAKTTASAPVVRDTTLRVRGVEPASSRFGRWVAVTVDNLHTLPRTGPRSADSLLLFVGGHPISDAHPKPGANGGDRVTFKLEHSPASTGAWSALLADSVLRARSVSISVGFRGGPAAAPADEARPPMLRFSAFTTLRFYYYLLGFSIALLGFIYMVFRSGILRDSAEESGRPMHERPYSLGRAQAAAWFFAIVAGFLYIRLVTNNYDSLTTQALLLLGVGTLTQAASGAVDNSVRGKARATLARLRPLLARARVEAKEMEAQEAGNPNADPAAMARLRTMIAGHHEATAEMKRELAQAEAVLRGSKSKGMVVDLVSDGQGVSLHRFQMVVWTVILIGIYLTQVVTTWTMPSFNPEMLALMGFSGGAFVGFKLLERQPEAPHTDPAADAPAAGAGAAADQAPEPISPQVFKVIADVQPAGAPAGGADGGGAGEEKPAQ